MSKVLAEITEETLDTGLRGVPVGHCSTSDVDPIKGVSYRGILIDKLKNVSSEEAMRLLFEGRLPDAKELAAFKEELVKRSEVHPKIIDAIENFDKNLHPMNRFVMSILMLDEFYPQKKYSEAAMNLVAKLPEIVATIFRAGSGWGERRKSRPELGYIENLVYLAKGEIPNAKDVANFMRLFHILHFDHSGGNLSTFVGKSTASGGANLYQSIASAMLALAGPLHGGANQEVLSFLKDTLKNVKDPSNKDEIKAYVRKLFAEGKKIFGFGHAVLRNEDSRATVFFDFGKETIPDDKLYQLAASLRVAGSEVLKENPKVQNPYPNVDSCSGVLLNALFSQDETYYTVLFGFGRCVGIAAQIVQEREVFNGGKGTPIMRPDYVYNGPAVQS